MAHRLAVLPDRIEHDAEHGDEDAQADQQHHGVQIVLFFGHLGSGRMQVELSHGRAAGQVIHGVRGGGHPSRDPQQSRSKFLAHGIHHVSAVFKV